MKLYGVAGTNGSGKDSLAAYLVESHNFLFVSSSDLLRDEARRRGLAVTRDVLRSISAEWRREGGLGVLVTKAVEHYKTKGGDAVFAGLVTGSLRNPGEAERIHELGGQMIWVDADPRVRYKRVTGNDRGRGDNEHNLTYEQFLADEQIEMTRSGDEATLDMSSVKQRSDIFVVNNTNSIVNFQKEIALKLGLTQ